ncbi:F0F1 ATP synthase subunit A [Muricauda ruestringensis]|uniref:F0F1 ATP synthase subunit A n=1 Tax=Flagellimonas ruestringensis TaxID=111501 RepID=UPI001CD62E1B|nr:F0F1 ATP synthase subunit A [Allomuricauda ruestringensis]MCA0958611.1 F0F1 ATP synthase subunit A [Allomuricauda ruestringensis]
MRNSFFSKKIVAVIFLIAGFVSAQNHEGEEVETGGHDLKTEIKEYIDHHLLDSHDFNLYSYTTDTGEHKYVGFPLPVILWDNGLKVFSSSKLKHGEGVAEVDGNYYKLYHNKIYKTDAEGTINYGEHHGEETHTEDAFGENLEVDDSHPTNKKPLDFSITKNVVFIIAVALLMFLVFRSMAKRYQKSTMPKGLGRFLEPLVLFVRDEIAIPNIGEHKYKRYMSYLLTVFFFVWIINLLGLTPLGVNVTNNIAVTFALAIITYFITTFTGNKNYWKHIFWMPGVPVPMKIILAPIELLGTFIKPFSLMIRLYANITAGHVVLMSIIGLMFIFKNWIGSPLSFLLAFALSLLELLVAALQAYIFTMLSALYFGMAVEEDHH